MQLLTYIIKYYHIIKVSAIISDNSLEFDAAALAGTSKHLD